MLASSKVIVAITHTHTHTYTHKVLSHSDEIVFFVRRYMTCVKNVKLENTETLHHTVCYITLWTEITWNIKHGPGSPPRHRAPLLCGVWMVN